MKGDEDGVCKAFGNHDHHVSRSLLWLTKGGLGYWTEESRILCEPPLTSATTFYLSTPSVRKRTQRLCLPVSSLPPSYTLNTKRNLKCILFEIRTSYGKIMHKQSTQPFLFVFNTGSLRSPCCPVTHPVDQASLELIEILLASASLVLGLQGWSSALLQARCHVRTTNTLKQGQLPQA